MRYATHATNDRTWYWQLSPLVIRSFNCYTWAMTIIFFGVCGCHCFATALSSLHVDSEWSDFKWTWKNHTLYGYGAEQISLFFSVFCFCPFLSPSLARFLSHVSHKHRVHICFRCFLSQFIELLIRQTAQSALVVHFLCPFFSLNYEFHEIHS